MRPRFTLKDKFKQHYSKTNLSWQCFSLSPCSRDRVRWGWVKHKSLNNAKPGEQRSNRVYMEAHWWERYHRKWRSRTTIPKSQRPLSAKRELSTVPAFLSGENKLQVPTWSGTPRDHWRKKKLHTNACDVVRDISCCLQNKYSSRAGECHASPLLCCSQLRERSDGNI